MEGLKTINLAHLNLEREELDKQTTFVPNVDISQLQQDHSPTLTMPSNVVVQSNGIATIFVPKWTVSDQVEDSGSGMRLGNPQPQTSCIKMPSASHEGTFKKHGLDLIFKNSPPVTATNSPGTSYGKKDRLRLIHENKTQTKQKQRFLFLKSFLPNHKSKHDSGGGKSKSKRANACSAVSYRNNSNVLSPEELNKLIDDPITTRPEPLPSCSGYVLNDSKGNDHLARMMRSPAESLTLAAWARTAERKRLESCSTVDSGVQCGMHRHSMSSSTNSELLSLNRQLSAEARFGGAERQNILGHVLHPERSQQLRPSTCAAPGEDPLPFSFRMLLKKPSEARFPRRPPPDYVRIALVLVLLPPVLPCAIPALIWALKARHDIKHGELQRAWYHSNHAFMTCLFALITLIFLLFGCTVAIFTQSLSTTDTHGKIVLTENRPNSSALFQQVLNNKRVKSSDTTGNGDLRDVVKHRDKASMNKGNEKPRNTSLSTVKPPS